MQTETTIETRDVDKAKLAVVRVVDFEKIAAGAEDGKVTVEALQSAGDFFVVITPSGRNAKQTRVAVGDALDGRSFCDGFETATSLRKRAAKTPAEKAAAKKAREEKKATKTATTKKK